MQVGRKHQITTMEHAVLPPIYAVRCVAGRWFMEAPNREPHAGPPLRAELQTNLTRAIRPTLPEPEKSMLPG